jgi:hypothetical protein
LEVSYGTGENKRWEMLTFEVASFNIRYNCILGRSFLLKFMAVIHTAYAIVKMPGPRGVITLKSDQCDTLACESTMLTHAGRLDKEEVQKLAAKVAKTHGGGTPAKKVMPGPSAGDTSKTPIAKQKQGMTVTPTPSAPPISWWPMRKRGSRTRRFRCTPLMPTKSFASLRS